MVLTYKKFLEENRRSIRSNQVMYVIGVKFKKDTCICMNLAREIYEMPISVLITDMMSGMGHINDASKLKAWDKWGTDIDYPADYWDNPKKYIKYIKAV